MIHKQTNKTFKLELTFNHRIVVGTFEDFFAKISSRSSCAQTPARPQTGSPVQARFRRTSFCFHRKVGNHFVVARLSQFQQIAQSARETRGTFAATWTNIWNNLYLIWDFYFNTWKNITLKLIKTVFVRKQYFFKDILNYLILNNVLHFHKVDCTKLKKSIRY